MIVKAIIIYTIIYITGLQVHSQFSEVKPILYRKTKYNVVKGMKQFDVLIRLSDPCEELPTGKFNPKKFSTNENNTLFEIKTKCNAIYRINIAEKLQAMASDFNNGNDYYLADAKQHRKSNSRLIPQSLIEGIGNLSPVPSPRPRMLNPMSNNVVAMAIEPPTCIRPLSDPSQADITRKKRGIADIFGGVSNAFVAVNTINVVANTISAINEEFNPKSNKNRLRSLKDTFIKHASEYQIQSGLTKNALVGLANNNTKITEKLIELEIQINSAIISSIGKQYYNDINTWTSDF